MNLTRSNGLNLSGLPVFVWVSLLCVLAVGVPGSALAENAVLRMATTTSVDHSGLLQHLLPHFEKETGLEVHVIAVGTGRALKLGENGDVDVLLVHAPNAEKAFVSKGFGTDREEIMYNDFLLVGPAQDPAGLLKCRSTKEVMARLSKGNLSFISRGDDSGTHKRERSLWAEAGMKPDGDWYLEVGRGMGPTLLMASEKQAYTLTDMGTYLAMRRKLKLVICFKGDRALLNTYSVMAVSPKRHPKARYAEALKFIRWIRSAKAQGLIGSFKIDDQILFRPKGTG